MTAIDETRDARGARRRRGRDVPATRRACPRSPFDFTMPVQEELAPLQTDEVHYDGQHVAAVVGATFEAAREGAALLRIEYERAAAEVTLDAAHQVDLPAAVVRQRRPAAPRRAGDGRTRRATCRSTRRTSRRPRTTTRSNRRSTVAEWRDGELTVHDSTQWVRGTRAALAKHFALDEERVRVIAPFLGGGFGCKGFFWPHTVDRRDGGEAHEPPGEARAHARADVHLVRPPQPDAPAPARRRLARRQAAGGAARRRSASRRASARSSSRRAASPRCCTTSRTSP